MLEIDTNQYSPDIIDKIAQYDHTFGALKKLEKFPLKGYPKLQVGNETNGQHEFWNDNLRWAIARIGFSLFEELSDLGLRPLAMQIRDKHKYV